MLRGKGVVWGGRMCGTTFVTSWSHFEGRARPWPDMSPEPRPD